ncbi:MAG: hypothetical protein A2758_00420 [Candidatus Zambryskibacteria bacterium RIFCSPHIGHO2_01_FULL_49_18]|uniref:DUF5673 domain-containing protein n=2 Tax=Candidatus Zambryskiibacteriota TaxID=1817925 RepID=A0A1G2T2S6_9BACT|nr:MAG: hypothetical protein A2758_00420 [Candidatus Zambryskibacteria bacterium RIFCSPHIGHO2_01_FULL_49_18]OHB05891.1 MAG: hypothetical protein A3A26_03005 [Candidatus Zambryskibacteria bacterium RIFCSPLOWO2_01_FULL_47_14]
MKKRLETFKIEWDAHEYEHKERSQDWFWAVGIVTLAAAITAVILGNIIFAILILTAVFALALYINRPPETVHVVVDEQGVTRGRVRYLYGSLESFWLDEDHPFPKMILKSKKLFMPLIVVPLGREVDAEKVNDALAHFLEEKFHSLPFVEKVLEYLGF